MVAQFYLDIAHLPQISEQEMCTQMQQLSIQNHDEFDTISALKELYIYVTNYRDQVRVLWDSLKRLSDWFSLPFQILDALDSDPNCKKMHLAHKLENVACTLEGENT
jgi:plexin A